MSIKDKSLVINCINTNTHDSLLLDKDNDMESNLILASLSVRDFKMLCFAKQCLRDGHTCTIYTGYKA